MSDDVSDDMHAMDELLNYAFLQDTLTDLGSRFPRVSPQITQDDAQATNKIFSRIFNYPKNVLTNLASENATQKIVQNFNDNALKTYLLRKHEVAINLMKNHVATRELYAQSQSTKSEGSAKTVQEPIMSEFSYANEWEKNANFMLEFLRTGSGWQWTYDEDEVEKVIRRAVVYTIRFELCDNSGDRNSVKQFLKKKFGVQKGGRQKTNQQTIPPIVLSPNDDIAEKITEYVDKFLGLDDKDKPRNKNDSTS